MNHRGGGGTDRTAAVKARCPMKKPVLISLLLLLCCALGWAVYLFTNTYRQGTPVRNTLSSTTAASAVPSYDSTRPGVTATPAPLDTTDDTLLLERAGEVLDALADQDYTALCALVHPQRGVTFTPYSTVDPENDLCFLPDQLSKAISDGSTYLWGFTNGKGDHINLTVSEYISRYVYNEDYRNAPVVSIDQIAVSGNALENVQEVFSDCRFVEYYYPGVKPEMDNFDWCALKVVLAPYAEQWYLVGLIHSEWTV